MKVSRLILLFKSLRRSFLQMLHPRRVQMIRNNGQVVDDKIVETTNAYLIAYVFILFVSFLLLSPDGFSTGTNFSAVLCCFNNIGPGLEAVGPTCNFSGFGILEQAGAHLRYAAGQAGNFPHSLPLLPPHLAPHRSIIEKIENARHCTSFDAMAGALFTAGDTGRRASS